MRNVAFSIFIALALGACAPRGFIAFAPDGPALGQKESVFIGTTRNALPDGGFGVERSEKLSFARYDVAIPPDREAGEIEWPRKNGRINPEQQFLTIDAARFTDAGAFRKNLAQAIAQQGGEVVLFVHGFNTNFAEGTYRLAQLKHDLDSPGVAVHYSWPSAAEPLGYFEDRDSALFARDGLEQLLQEVKAAGARRIILVAHSMGCAVAMETLRQIALRGNDALLARIGGVVLISPDLDVDLFRAQAMSMKKLPQPFIVFSSEKDRILQLSARLSGRKDRLGTLTNLTPVADLPIIFIDTRAFNKGVGHFNVGSSPALIALMDRLATIDDALNADRAARTGLLPGVVLTAQNATQIILRPMAEIGTAR